jgi:hypothetical protein
MNNEIETYIYDNYVSKLIKYSKDTKYILKQDIDSLNLSENEKIFFYSILKNRTTQLQLLNYKLLQASIRSYHLPQTLILRLLCGSREPSLSVPPYSIS